MSARPLPQGGASNPSHLRLIDWISLAVFLTPVAGSIAYHIAASL